MPFDEKTIQKILKGMGVDTTAPRGPKQPCKEEQGIKYIFGYHCYDGTIKYHVGNSYDDNPSILRAKQFDSKEAMDKYIEKRKPMVDFTCKVYVQVTPQVVEERNKHV